MIGSNLCRDSAIEQFVFFCVKASVAAVKIDSSCEFAPAVDALSDEAFSSHVVRKLIRYRMRRGGRRSKNVFENLGGIRHLDTLA
jgi:hypothetical protein